MTKTASYSTTTTVRDSKSGRFVTVKGAGALKGKMTISKKVDLTKPISIPAKTGKWASKTSNFAANSPCKTKSDNSSAKR